jgi:4-amino-4-deoxy-L-arabinose transferase-like glycosyltransferase
MDEARLALAAGGIAEHGWPVLPSGKVYTRGLVPAVLMAPSLALLGPTDFAARLPSLIVGVLLIGVMYLYGRSLAGVGAGLVAAALATTSVSLVFWSRQAWLYSSLSFFWLLALYLLNRAIATGSGRALLLGACAIALGLLTHEFTLLLLPATGLYLLTWARREPRRGPRARGILGTLCVIAAALGLLTAFTLTLRSDTLAGSMGEVNDYVRPSLRTDLHELPGYFFGRLFPDRGWLLPLVAAAGLALADARQRWRLVLLLAAILPLFMVLSVAIPTRSERYGVALIPPVLLLAAVGAAIAAGLLARHLPSRLGLAAAAAVYLVALLGQPDPATLRRRTDPIGLRTTWVADLYKLGYQPGDIVLTDLPPVTEFYLGRTDFWLRSRSYEKYTTTSFDGRVRDIHTRALLVDSVGRFEQLVRRPRNRGETAWVVASHADVQWLNTLDPKLREHLVTLSVADKGTRGGPHLYRLRL